MALWPSAALAQFVPPPIPPTQPAILTGVSIDQKLGEQVPLDLTFRDEAGRPVQLRDLVHDKPVILSLVYYRCPMLCTVSLNELLRSLQALPLKLDDQYTVLTVSFDPTETPDLAAAKKRSYVQAYGRSGAQEGWHFLTGDASNIAALTNAVGFHYRWDKASHQFIHPAGLVILTPDGRISRYFFGIDYEPFDLRMALTEATNNRVGTVTDKALLYCFQYDPASGRYGPAVFTALKLAGGLVVLALGGGMLWLVRKDLRRTRTLLVQIPSPHAVAAHRDSASNGGG